MDIPNSMDFPKTWEEFAEQYGFCDEEQIYTNGAILIPVFRVNQWLEHIQLGRADDGHKNED